MNTYNYNYGYNYPLVKQAGSFEKEMLNNSMDVIKSTLDTGSDAAGDLFKWLANKGGDFVDWTGGKIEDAADALKNLPTNAGKAWDKIKHYNLDKAGKDIEQAGRDIADYMSRKTKELGQFGKSMGKKIRSVPKNIEEAIENINNSRIVAGTSHQGNWKEILKNVMDNNFTNDDWKEVLHNVMTKGSFSKTFKDRAGLRDIGNLMLNNPGRTMAYGVGIPAATYGAMKLYDMYNNPSEKQSSYNLNKYAGWGNVAPNVLTGALAGGVTGALSGYLRQPGIRRIYKA